MTEQHKIPSTLNLFIAAAAIGSALACLWTASHVDSFIWVIVVAVVFSYVNNTIFSLHHEAVHQNFHCNSRINESAGVIFAAFFPTIFAIQRISHLGHHRRNRSDEELYDYYLPHQSWLVKTYWLYCLLTGFYWSIIPVACLVYMICPWVFRSKAFIDGPARWWGFRPFVIDIANAPIASVWPQGCVTLAVQCAMFCFLDLNFLAWLICYWAFGINWSSVQYSDHAGSPRHVTEGAWNLRFWPGAQWAFLNYNFHLAHHRQPHLPWIHLPSQVRAEDPSPSFWAIYLRLWLGARRAPVDSQKPGRYSVLDQQE